MNRFAPWLRARGYAPTTVDLYVGTVEAIRAGRTSRSASMRALRWKAWQAWRACCRSHGDLVPPELERTEGEPARRRREVAPWSEAEWEQLLGAARRDETPEGAVLAVELGSGMRVGDVLRLDRATLRRIVEHGAGEYVAKGGRGRVFVPDAGQHDDLGVLLERLERSSHDTVAALVTDGRNPSSTPRGTARRRVARRLAEYAAWYEIPGRANTHRARHTIAVRVYQRSGNDVRAAQDALGHEHATTTLRYLDATPGLAREVVGVPRRESR